MIIESNLELKLWRNSLDEIRGEGWKKSEGFLKYIKLNDILTAVEELVFKDISHLLLLLITVFTSFLTVSGYVNVVSLFECCSLRL